MKDYVKDLYKRLSENIGETPELFHYDYFKLEGGGVLHGEGNLPLNKEDLIFFWYLIAFKIILNL